MTVAPGRSFPLGATVGEGGVNFCIYCGRAKQLELLLFDGAADAEPARVIHLDARTHRTYHYWHAFVRDGHGPTGVTANGTAVPFEREANPYRSGGARLPMAALAPLLTAGENEIVVQLG